jgi:hypothetical protein
MSSLGHEIVVTGPNTLGVVSTHSGYSSESSSMRGVLFGTLDTFYFQQNTSPCISHDTDTMMTQSGTGGLQFLSTIRCLSIDEPFSHRKCYGTLAMCIIGCAGPPTPSKIRMYHTLVVAPAFLAIFTIGPSATVSR